MSGAGQPGEVRLVDAARLAQGQRLELVRHSGLPEQIMLLGIDDPLERAGLLAAGCGEALPSMTGLGELDIRAHRLASLSDLLPRLRDAGPVTLDLFHRDGRIGQSWLALHPREFGLIWRLAECPGRPVTRAELLHDVWRLRHDPETNSVQVHVSRLRSKLAAHGLGALVATDPVGGYCLTPS
jgi:DNA-binding response OmpR family regulator